MTDYMHLVFTCRLTKDPEGRYTPAGKFVCTMPVAINLGFGDNKQTIWARVTAWEKLGETCAQYLHKGSKALIDGRLNPDEGGNPRTFTRQDGTPAASFEVTASVVRFLTSREEASEYQAESQDDGDGVPF